jgi:hypothetical protein
MPHSGGYGKHTQRVLFGCDWWRCCAVRVRDGSGLVGPLVIPGATSCLVNH